MSPIVAPVDATPLTIAAIGGPLGYSVGSLHSGEIATMIETLFSSWISSPGWILMRFSPSY